MGDARAAALVATWSGVQMTIVIDANIWRVRSWLLFNLIGIVVYIVTWIAISFVLIDRMQAFLLTNHRYHDLSAASVAMCGLITIIAVFARNVYRRRNMLRKQSHEPHIECASYRTDLQFYPLMSIPKSRSYVISSKRPESIKAMKYAQQIGAIDARNTLLSGPPHDCDSLLSAWTEIVLVAWSSRALSIREWGALLSETRTHSRTH